MAIASPYMLHAKGIGLVPGRPVSWKDVSPWIVSAGCWPGVSEAQWPGETSWVYVSFSEVVCTEYQKSPALSRCAAEYPAFTSHLDYPEIMGRPVHATSETDSTQRSSRVGSEAGSAPRRRGSPIASAGHLSDLEHDRVEDGACFSGQLRIDRFVELDHPEHGALAVQVDHPVGFPFSGGRVPAGA